MKLYARLKFWVNKLLKKTLPVTSLEQFELALEEAKTKRKEIVERKNDLQAKQITTNDKIVVLEKTIENYKSQAAKLKGEEVDSTDARVVALFRKLQIAQTKLECQQQILKANTVEVENHVNLCEQIELKIVNLECKLEQLKTKQICIDTFSSFEKLTVTNSNIDIEEISDKLQHEYVKSNLALDELRLEIEIDSNVQKESDESYDNFWNSL